MTHSDSQVQMDTMRRDETQDSQAILDAIRVELGMEKLNGESHICPDANSLQSGIGNSYPVTHPSVQPSISKQGSCDRDPLESKKQASHLRRELEEANKAKNAANQASATAYIEVPSSDPPVTSEALITQKRPPQPAIVRNARRLDNEFQSAGNATTRKMDVSQQTPTQPNEDRDYEDAVCASLPTSPAPELAPEPETEDRTLHSNDTGAVNFDLGRPSSQISEDGGFENTRGDWRSQQQSNNLHTPFKPQDQAFETPALPKNPFAAATFANPAPFAGSQLFGQTQFSSTIKKFSPTSSRPSPNILPNSFSPHIAETSPLKGRQNVSSPTIIRSSSPNPLDDVPVTVSRLRNMVRIDEETSTASRSPGEDIIPESPTIKGSTSSGNYQPLAHYEPMKKSQERKINSEPDYTFVGSDSDPDDPIRLRERRKKVERKRARAVQEMERVSFTPLLQRSSSGKEPARKKRRTEGERYIRQCEGPRDTDTSTKSEEDGPCLVDSQQRAAYSNELLIDGTTQGTEEPDLKVEQVVHNQDMAVKARGPEPLWVEEMILATSPAAVPPVSLHIEPELPTLVPDEPQLPPGSNAAAFSSLPVSRARRPRTYGKKTRQPRRNTVISSSASEAQFKEVVASTDRATSPTSSPASTAVPQQDTDTRLAEDVVLSVETETTPKARIGLPSRRSSSKSAASTSTNFQTKAPSPLTPLGTTFTEAPATRETSSSLSEPPSTVTSTSTTPETGISLRSDRTDLLVGPCPEKDKGLRKRALKPGLSPQPASRNLRVAKQNVRYGSESTDELYGMSPSVGALDKSSIYPRPSGRISRQSLGPAPQGGRIFEGMAFALSFQIDSKPQDRTKLEAKIVQAGGVILPDGFEPLFERSSIMDTAKPVFDDDEPLKLVRPYADIGFTALIADGHSRKAKYMQALALGLPCLAHHWVTACLNKGEAVDWEHYLLCSGNSSVLGNAIRSRKLTPYSTEKAKLPTTITQRPTLLLNQRILLVVDQKKGRTEAKQPYIFLAKALGPSMSRVFTTSQATIALLEHANAGRPFDWLYVDSGTGSVESVLCAPGAGGKRKGTKPAVCSPAFGNIRVLDDEIVIQSLILGRMLEGEEIGLGGWGLI